MYIHNWSVSIIPNYVHSYQWHFYIHVLQDLCPKGKLEMVGISFKVFLYYKLRITFKLKLTSVHQVYAD